MELFSAKDLGRGFGFRRDFRSSKSNSTPGGFGGFVGGFPQFTPRIALSSIHLCAPIKDTSVLLSTHIAIEEKNRWRQEDRFCLHRRWRFAMAISLSPPTRLLLLHPGANPRRHRQRRMMIATNSGLGNYVQDVLARILSFSLSGPRGVCVLSATGTVSNVAIRQPGSPGGATFSYEGRFEILSLMGSYVANDSGGRSTTGGLSVSLAGSDGLVIGGAVAGVLRAATPIQMVVGSFSTGAFKVKRKYQRRAHNPYTISPAGQDQSLGSIVAWFWVI